MTYTSLKITDNTVVLNSECPRCGTRNSNTLEKSISKVRKVDVQCFSCFKKYRASLFSSRWYSLARKAGDEASPPKKVLRF
jgi:rRNA maturation endonuclease Nob1